MLGYNGTDLFSPEMDYAVQAADLSPYVARVNRLLAAKGFGPLTVAQLTGQVNQFKAFIDLCHLHGIAVIADVVYNHAGGGFDEQSIWFFDFQPRMTNKNVTAQVGRLNQVCGPAYTEKRRQIPSNSTTGLIREGLPGHARGVPGQLQYSRYLLDTYSDLLWAKCPIVMG